LNGGVVSGGSLIATNYAVNSGTISSVLGGVASLTKDTAGTVRLSGLNNYSGNTTVLGGVLQLGGNQVLSIGGTVTVEGGVLDLGGAYQNTVAALVLNDGSIVGGSGSAATISANQFLVSNGSIGAVLAGAGALTKNTAGTVTLSGQNTYAGDTTVNLGRLVLGGSQVLSIGGTVTVNGGVLDLGGAYQNTVGSVVLNDGAIEGGAGARIVAGQFLVSNGSISAVLAGAGALTKNSAGTVVLSGQNAYTGETTVNAGRLVLGGSGVLWSTAPLTMNGGTLDLGGDFINRVSVLRLNGGEIERGSISATSVEALVGSVSAGFGGLGSFTKNGAGLVTLLGVSTYSGGTTVNEGTLSLVLDNALNGSGAVRVNQGELSLGTSRQAVGVLTLAGGVIRGGSVSGASYEVQAGTLMTALVGSGGLTKSTGGTVNLNTVASYTGGTTVNGGTLALGLSNALNAGGAVTVAGGDLILGATAQTVGAFRLVDGAVQGGILTAGSFGLENGLVSGVLGGVGAVTKSTAGTVTLGGANTLTGAMAITGGTLALGGAGLLTLGSVTVSGALTALALGATEQTVGAFRLVDGSVSNGSLMAGSFGVENGLVSAVLGGAGTLTKSTAGTVTLSGANALTGAMDITGGTLAIGGAGLLTSGSVTVGGAAVLALGATAQTVGAFRLVDGAVQGGTLTAGSFGVENGLVSAVLSGSGMLTKSTAGTVTLGGANTLTGAMAITGGTLALGGAGLLTRGSVMVSGTAVLALGATAQTVGAFRLVDGSVSNGSLTAGSFDVENGLVSAVLGGAGTLTKRTAGTVTLGGANTLAGAVAITGGTLALGGAGLLTSGSVTLSGASTVLGLGATAQTVGAFRLVDGVVSNGSLTAGSFDVENGLVSAVLGGAGTLTKRTAGTVTLGGANTLTGAVAITGGTLALGGTGSLTSGSVTLSGASTVLALGATAQSVGAFRLVDGSVSNGSLTAGTFDVENGLVSAVLGGAGTLTKSTAGTVTLGGANTLAGAVAITGGTLALSGAGLLTSGSVTVGGAATVLALGATAQTVAAFRLVDGTVTNGSLTAGVYEVENGLVSAVLGGAGTLTKSTAGTVILGGANWMTGAMNVAGGTLALGVAGLLTSGSVTVSGAAAVLELGATAQTVAAFRLADGTVRNGSLTAGNYSVENGLVSAVLNGAAVLTKSTAGTVTLTGANKLTGATEITAGTLALGGAGLLSSGNLRVQNAGTVLELGGTSQTVGVVTLAGGLIQGGALEGRDYAFESGMVNALLSGPAGLTKSGEGLVALGGGVANTFTGATRVQAGTLRLAGLGVMLASGTVEVSGGRLEMALSNQLNAKAAVLVTGGIFGFADNVSGLVAEVDSLRVTGGTLITGANSLKGTGSTIRLEGGRTVVSAGGSLQDQHIVLSGGNNVIEGGGSLWVTPTKPGAEASGLELKGGAGVLLTIQGGATPGNFRIENDITVNADNGAATIGGTGLVDLGAGLHQLTVNGGGSTGALRLEAGIGNGGLVKMGTGALVLAGETKLDQGLALRQGALEIDKTATVLQAGTGQIAFEGGLVRYAAGAAQDISALIKPVAVGQSVRIDTNGQSVVFGTPLNAAGTLELTGAGGLSVSGQFGVFNLNGGRLSGGTLSAEAFNISSGILDGNITGNGTLTKTGDGTLIVTGFNDGFTGATFINSGTLQLGNGGSSAATLGGTLQAGPLVNNGVLAFKFQPGTELVFANALSGSGKIAYIPVEGVKSGGFSVDFQGTNTSKGGTELSEGVSLLLTDDKKLGSGSIEAESAPLTLDGGVVKVGVGTLGAGTLVTINPNRTIVLSKNGATFVVGGTSVNSGVENKLVLAARVDSGTAAGSLVKDGNGVLVLANSNNYGATVVKAGTLQVGISGVSGSLGQGAVDIYGAGRLALQRGDEWTLGQTITGSGVLSIGGGDVAETVKLTGSNTFTGETVVQGGASMQVISAGALLLGQRIEGVSIFNGQVTGGILTGAVGATGVVSGGTFTEVTIHGGTLEISGGIRLETGAVLKITPDTVGANTVTVGNVISGAGKLVISGTATGAPLQVSLGKASVYTGETEVNDATLRLSSITVGTLSGMSSSGGTLTSGSLLGISLSYGSIANSSAIKLQSGGTLDVTAYDALGGYLIPAGQTLTGSRGVVKGTLKLAGKISPGNSPGPMTVNSLELQPGAEYQAEFNQKTNEADHLIIDGGVLNAGTIGTRVVATALSRTVESKSYAIITGGTVKGTFESVTAEFFQDWVDNDPSLRSQLQLRDPLAFGGTLSPSGATAVLIPHLRYGTSEVLLEIERKPFKSFGLGINAQEIGAYLDGFVAAPGELLALEVQLEAYKFAQQVSAALSGAGVSPYADLLTISRRRMLDLTAGVGSRLDLLGLQGARNGGVESMVGSGETGWSVWQSTTVSQLTRQAAAAEGFGGYNSSGQSSVMGLERPFGAGRIGLIGAVGSSSANFTLPSTTIKSESWHLGSYVSLPVAPFFADIAFIYGRVDNDARRNIELPGYNTRARALFGSDEYTLRIGGGLQIMPAQSDWEITPTEHLLYVGGAQAALEETGAGVLSQGGGLGARLQKSKMSGLLNEVGLTVGRRWVVRGVPVAVRLQANWLHDFDGTGSVQASFVGAPASAGWFTARNASGDRDALKVSTSIEVSLTQRLSLRIGGEYERRKSSTKSSLTISMGMEF